MHDVSKVNATCLTLDEETNFTLREVIPYFMMLLTHTLLRPASDAISLCWNCYKGNSVCW